MRTACYIILAIALLAGAFVLGRRTAVEEPQTIERVVTKVDTFKAVETAYFRVFVKDTIRVAVTDTIRLRDTLFVEIPREVKEYRDSTYFARVSGFQPELEYIEVYSRTTEVTRTERVPAPRLSVGVQLGAGLQYGIIRQGVDIGPYLGVGVQCRFGK